jgi:hypothetical protein
LTIKFTQSTSAASGRVNRLLALSFWLKTNDRSTNCQRNSMTYASVHREVFNTRVSR